MAGSERTTKRRACKRTECPRGRARRGGGAMSIDTLLARAYACLLPDTAVPGAEVDAVLDAIEARLPATALGEAYAARQAWLADAELGSAA